MSGEEGDASGQVKMGLKSIPPQSVLAKEGKQGVAVSPVSLQRRTDV